MMPASSRGERSLAQALIPSVLAAGQAILAARAAGLTVERKADASPVTEADRAAEDLILAGLRVVAAGVPVVAEEQVAAGCIPVLADAFFLVDALDGTKDFLRGGPDFTVNVGLVRDGEPVLGVVHAPATGRLWIGLAGDGAFATSAATPADWRPIGVRPAPEAAPDIVASLSHRTPETDAFIARYPGARVVAAGSSLKFCVLAEGTADLYPRLGPTSQWDTAAGHAVLTAAGGRVLTMAGTPLPYGKGSGAQPFLNPWFVATAGLDPFA